MGPKKGGTGGISPPGREVTSERYSGFESHCLKPATQGYKCTLMTFEFCLMVCVPQVNRVDQDRLIGW